MEEKNFKYNAFISYRHSDLDKFVAENLHKLVETYKMPEAIIKKFNITDKNIRRVFRDQEELPLSPSLEDPIIEALKNSEFLIVICSPRLKESLWCKKEIENFIKFHGRNNVLCVLIEGEPKDSFPEELLSYEEETKDKSGKIVKKKVYCEPLAMDVRGKNKKEIYHKLKTDIVRIMAPLYQLDYDDIKRRHEERELKRKANIFKIAAIVSILFALYSFLLFSRIYISSNELKYNQSIHLANQANELLAKDDRNGAIEKSMQAVTKYNNIKMPITAKGIYELTDSLGVYYDSTLYYPVSQLDTLGEVKHMKINTDQNYLLSYDDSGDLILWDLSNETKVKTISDTVSHMEEENYTFIGKKYFAYLNEKNEVVILNLKGEEINKIIPELSKENIPFGFTDELYEIQKLLKDSVFNEGVEELINDYASYTLQASINGKYIAISDGNKITTYETEEFKKVATYTLPEGMQIKGELYFDLKEENLLFATTSKEDKNEGTLNLVTYHIEKQKIICSTSIKAHKIKKVLFKDDYVNILAIREVKNNEDYRGNYGTDSLLIRYNYKNGKIDLKKIFEGASYDNINMAFSEDGNNTFLISGSGNAYLLDYKTGNQRSSYTLGTFASGIYIQSFHKSGGYLLFSSNGTVFNISNKESTYSTNFMFVDYYNFHLKSYSQFLYSQIGYLAIPNGENRIIIYSHLKNEERKKIEYERKQTSAGESIDKDSVIEEYNFKNKAFIETMFYSEDKEILFVAYKNNKLEIYDNQTKKLQKETEMLKGIPQNYVCKTENNEHIIKGTGGGYILNKDFDPIAYVPALQDYDNGKIIISDWNDYYEVKKYSEKEIIKMGEEYLKSKGKSE